VFIGFDLDELTPGDWTHVPPTPAWTRGRSPRNVSPDTRPNYTSSLLAAGVYASMVPMTMIGCAAYILTALCLTNLRTFHPAARSESRDRPWPDRRDRGG
jgi:hypothetical protein